MTRLPEPMTIVSILVCPRCESTAISFGVDSETDPKPNTYAGCTRCGTQIALVEAMTKGEPLQWKCAPAKVTTAELQKILGMARGGWAAGNGLGDAD